ncbi:MAG TPA: FhaA domain-containing protein [Pyrinomonadaceae bacterium]|nr:FhaA domain-containing protein [Pyrinomonadaceae bacterium]
MSVLDKVRRWIDGETAELVLEEAARDAQVKPRSKAEEFIVKIAREVEGVMQRELVPLPQGTTIIPSEYAIFLSDEDDKEWQGVKRRGLEQGLYHILAERAKEIAGKRKLETKSFVIELRVDGTLEKGNLRVQHSWEDTSTAGKTGVLARPKSGNLKNPSQPLPEVNRPPAKPTNPNYSRRSMEQAYTPPPNAPNFTQPKPPTGNIAQAVPLPPEEGEELTSVRSRSVEIYKLEIWMEGVRQNVVPIFNKEVSVGRGSRSKPVDIALSGDPEISRRHLTLGADGQGGFWAMNEGRNPAMIGNYELPAGQRVRLNPGVNLAIGRYILRIQPRT